MRCPLSTVRSEVDYERFLRPARDPPNARPPPSRSRPRPAPNWTSAPVFGVVVMPWPPPDAVVVVVVVIEMLPLAVDAVVVDGVVVVVEVVELPETLPVPVVVELVVVDGEVVVELVVLEPDTLPVPVVVELVVVLLLTTAGQVWVRLKTWSSPPVGVPDPLSALPLASSRIDPGGADAKKNFVLLSIVPVVPPVSKVTVGAGAVKPLPGSPAVGSTNTK